MRRTLLALSLLISTVITCNVQAGPRIVVGAPLPKLEISNKGELVIENKRIVYQAWSSQNLGPRVHVVQYLAGRMSTSKMNKAFTDKLETLDLSREHYLTTSIINLKDAFFGTSGFVSSELKSNKMKYAWSSMVADKRGHGARQWGLKAKSSAIIVLSPKGKVLFFKDGSLSSAEIEHVSQLLQQQIALLAAEQATSKHSL